MARFEIGEDAFELDGKPFRIIGGALHYFRVHPGQWADRIHKARLMGLNTIETYIAWNVHAPRPGRFDVSGPSDVGRFLDLVAAEGMHAIVRPGPYICAEWRGGGLPAWLFADPEMRLRTDEPRYLDQVRRYFAQILPVVRERQVSRGGPVLAVQVENEYGAYPGVARETRERYLRALVRMLREGGIDVPLFTCDQANDEMQELGGLPELLHTLTFGSHAEQAFDLLRRHQPTGPLMCAEFWDGWFDSWGRPHHVTDARRVAGELDAILRRGASVSIYMFHGGTNFGRGAGANHKGRYVPITTSYDYDAPLDEAGRTTPKYDAMRRVIARYGPVPSERPAPWRPAPRREAAFARVADARPLWEAASGWRAFGELPDADRVGGGALVAYRTRLRAGENVVAFGDVRDVALVLLDGAPVGTLHRVLGERALLLAPHEDAELCVVVEQLGRVDYGERLGERVGLIAPARSDRRELRRWEAVSIDVDASVCERVLEDAGADRPDADAPIGGPAILGADVESEPGRDLYLSTAGWGRGEAWFNGFALGRYWSAGPTRTMYVPGSAVRRRNRLVVFERGGMARGLARFVPEPDLGHLEE